jgi:hypothetical protein
LGVPWLMISEEPSAAPNGVSTRAVSMGGLSCPSQSVARPERSMGRRY